MSRTLPLGRITPMLVPMVSLCLAAAGCISLERRDEFAPDAPTYIRPAGRALAGSRREEILLVAKKTVATGTFDVQLVRRVAERARPAVVSLYVKDSYLLTKRRIWLYVSDAPERKRPTVRAILRQ